MKYLNSKIEDLMYGRKVTYRGKVYWANRTTMEIYAHSVDDEILGSITGYKVADITHDFKVVKCSGMGRYMLMPKKYKGWDIEFTGHGYELTKLHPVTRQIMKAHAKTLAHAKTVIINHEARMNLGGKREE